MKQELYRQQDYRAAVREHACAEDCLKDISDALRSGDLMTAMQRTFDLEATTMELRRLAGKKAQEKALIEEMKRKGNSIEVVVKSNVLF